jgi:hypothetical protein
MASSWFVLLKALSVVEYSHCNRHSFIAPHFGLVKYRLWLTTLYLYHEHALICTFGQLKGTNCTLTANSSDVGFPIILNDSPICIPISWLVFLYLVSLLQRRQLNQSLPMWPNNLSFLSSTYSLSIFILFRSCLILSLAILSCLLILKIIL